MDGDESFENDTTGQRDGLSEELIFEPRSRNKREAAMVPLGRNSPGREMQEVWEELLQSQTGKAQVTGLGRSRRAAGGGAEAQGSFTCRVHNSRGRCPDLQPACNRRLP